MGLRGAFKKKIKQVAGAAEDVGTSAANVASRVAKAPVGYAERLKTNVKAELADPTSEGYRFAHAPAGQYFLPKPARKALSFVLPTPAETVNSQKQFVKKPGIGTGFRAAMPLVQIATAPALVTGAAALPGAVRAGASGIAQRGFMKTLGSESGARVIGGLAKKAPTTAAEVASAGAKVQAAKSITGAAARAERVGGKIAGERVASVGLADEAADVAKAAHLQNVPETVLKGMRTPAAKLEKVRRLEARPGAPGGGTRSVTAPEAIAKAGIEPVRAPRSRIAGAVSTANRPQGGLRAASTAPATPTASEVAQHAANSVFQRMPDIPLQRMAAQGVGGAKTEVAARAAAKATPKPAFGAGAKVVSPAQATQTVVKPTVSEAVSVAPKKGGLSMPSKAEAKAVVAEVKAAAPKAKVAPRGSNPAYTRKPGKVTTRPIPQTGVHPGTGRPVELTPRGTIAPKPKGGSVAGAPRGAAVKRPVTAGLEEALAAAGEKPAVTVAARAVKVEKFKDGSGAAESIRASQAAKAEVKMARAGKAAPKAAKAAPSAKAPKVAPTPTPGEAAATASPAATVAKRSVFGKGKKVLKTTLKTVKIAAEVSLPLAAGGVLLSNRGKGGAIQNATPQPQGATAAPAQTVDEAIANLTDPEQRASMTALRAVQKKGEAEGYDALAALREGLESATTSPDFPSRAELQHPQVSERFGKRYKELLGAGVAPEKAQGKVLEEVGKKRDELLRENVARVVTQYKQRAENEKLRKKNR